MSLQSARPCALAALSGAHCSRDTLSRHAYQVPRGPELLAPATVLQPTSLLHALRCAAPLWLSAQSVMHLLELVWVTGFALYLRASAILHRKGCRGVKSMLRTRRWQRQSGKPQFWTSTCMAW